MIFTTANVELLAKYTSQALHQCTDPLQWPMQTCARRVVGSSEPPQKGSKTPEGREGRLRERALRN